MFQRWERCNLTPCLTKDQNENNESESESEEEQLKGNTSGLMSQDIFT